jgi:outer membrane protein OmpA-like peptidoglycan-associated protein
MQILSNLMILLLLTSCAPTPKPNPEPTPMQLEVAIPLLTTQLFSQVKESQSVFDGFGNQQVVLDPFIDINSGEVVEVSRDIETLITNEAKNKFEQFTITRLTPEALTQANYLMTGVIRYDDYGAGQKFYRVLSSIVDLKTGAVVAHSKAWIADRKLAYKPRISNPIPSAKDQDCKDVAQSEVGTNVSQQKCYAARETQATLVAAEAAYEAGNYSEALDLFKKVTASSDGQLMRAYSGLYQTYKNLGDQAGAKEAFDKLVELGVNNQELNARFLFLVDKTEFNQELKSEYALWLQSMADYFSNTNLCFNIIGHSSKSGSPDYNKKLSLRRAEKVQQELATYVPALQKKIQIYGEGFDKNLVGSGTDDDQDAIDRRVEFKIVDCS